MVGIYHQQKFYGYLLGYKKVSWASLSMDVVDISGIPQQQKICP